MKKQMIVPALAATTLAVMAGCASGPTPSPAADSGRLTAASGTPELTPTADPAAEPSPGRRPPTTGPRTGGPATSRPTTRPTTKPAPPTPTDSGTTARIVSFTLVQKPKCPEGTAVFRAPAVPAIIRWRITGATGAALSVDDHTHTAGTYGPEPLSGTETFTFGCHGPVGSTETHTYAIYTVGGGKQHSMTITATAKVIDDGKN